LKLKTNIGTKLSHFDTWQNYEVTRVKNLKNSKKNKKNKKKIQKKKSKKILKIKKNQKLTRGVDFNTVWSKLTVRTKLSHF